MSTPSTPLAYASLADENRLLRERIAGMERESARPIFSLLNHLMENAPLGIAFLDSNFRYLAVNRHLAEMNGLAAEEHIGRTVDEVVPFVAEQARRAFRQVMESGLPLFDQEFTGAPAWQPGDLRHYSLTWFPVAIAGIVDAVGIVVTDVTERKRIEESLRHHENSLLAANQNAMRQLGEIEALYAGVPAAVALVDPELRYVRVNGKMAEFNGCTVAETIGRRVPDVIPDLWPHLEPLYRRVIEHRQPVHAAEIRGFTAARPGVERCWTASYEPVTSEDGRFIGVSVFVLEVTDSKRAEKALKESAQQMQRQLAEIEAIYASAPIGLCVFDDQFRWTRINRRMAELIGLPPEAHIGASFPEIVPSLAAQGEAAFRQVMRTGEPLLDFELSRSVPDDGAIRYFNNHWVPLKDEGGHVVGVSVAIEETTGRRRVEESLRQSERLYRAIGESIDYGVWVCSPDGRNTYASPSFLKLVGMTQEQCSDLGWADVLHPDEVERTTAAWLECVRTQGRWDAEHRFRGVDGQYHTVLARGVPVRDDHGTLICFAGINLDITLLKRTEERLREGQKLESIGLLAGGIAHDFNNMLVGVIGNASLAQEMLPPEHPAGAFMEDVIKTGERAAHLTRQMLAYSGKGRFVIEPLQLSELIAEMRGLVQSSVTKKISLHLDLGKDMPRILADAGQMQQVLLNLVINAAEAIGGDSGEIGIRTGILDVDEGFSRAGIEVGEPHPGRYVFLEVSDTGCGMDAATRTRIFDPFFSTKFTGRGLGLAALSGIVRAHQGAVRVTSSPGAGSSFTVLFPAAGSVPAEAVAPQKPLPLQRPGTVLVVDDEETVRQIARKTLERAGYKVLVAESGTAAIDLCRRHSGGLSMVVLDLSMPGMSGQETLPELRKIRPDVPVIVSSGYSESETMRLFEGQRVSAFLQKPYTSRRLAEIIASNLE